MSEKTKVFGAGAILSPLFLAIIIGAISMVGSWASKVPELETTVKLEFNHMQSSVEKLTDAQTSTNVALQKHADNDTKMIKILSETVLGHDYMIKQMIKERGGS